MEGLQKDGKFVFEQGKAIVEVGASVDQDADGKASVEAGMYVKLDVAELLQEIGKSKDQKTLLAASAFIEQFQAALPKIEKDIL